MDLLSKARTADQIRIDKPSSDNEAMQNQLKALGVKPAVSGGEPAPTPPSPPPGPEGEPQPASYHAANRRRGTASDGILSGKWYDTAAAGQLPVCTGTKPDTA